MNITKHLTIVSFFILLAGCPSRDSEYAKKIILRVNDVELSAGEYAQRLARTLKPFDALAVKDEENVKRAKQMVMKNFIVEAVVQSWAKQNNLFVRKEELDQEIKKIRLGYPDDVAFRRALAEEGLNYDTWENMTRISRLQRVVVDHVTADIKKPSPAEIQAYYEANRKDFEKPEAIRLRQIVVDSEESAKHIVQELSKRREFADLARKFSIAPEAEKGGELGWVERGTLGIFDKAFGQPKGYRSQIVRSPYGFHIFEVMERRPAKKISLAEAQTQIAQRLLEEKKQITYQSWLEKQIKGASIFTDQVYIDRLTVETKVN